MDDNKISLVNTRGRVIWIAQKEVPALLQQGFRLIHNPKESYYPDMDTTINRGQVDSNPQDLGEDSSFLEILVI